jgi:hypothetical protein
MAIGNYRDKPWMKLGGRVGKDNSEGQARRGRKEKAKFGSPASLCYTWGRSIEEYCPLQMF